MRSNNRNNGGTQMKPVAFDPWLETERHPNHNGKYGEILKNSERKIGRFSRLVPAERERCDIEEKQIGE
jgi:hypothetical protein